MKNKPLIRLLAAQGALQYGHACHKATVQFGAMVTDLKGSTGGHTFKGNTSGTSLQTKINRSASGKAGGKVTTNNAARLINPLINTGINATQWRSLSDADRSTWVAAAPNFPFLNKYGVAYTPSGFQLYMSVNNNLLGIGLPAITVAPAVTPTANMPLFTITSSGPVVWNLDVPGGIPAGNTATIYATTSQSVGRGLEPGRLKAIIQVDSSTTFPLLIAAEYSKVFGTMPTTGFAYAVGRITDVVTGRQGVPFQISVTW